MPNTYLDLVVRFSAEERARGQAARSTLVQAHRQFDTHGLLVAQNALDPDLVAEMGSAFARRYPQYLEDREHADALKVGDKRVMVSVALEPPFADPRVYANPLLLPLLRTFLSPRVLLGSFGVVAALPGAQAQHVHVDHPGLFRDERLDVLLPPHAISMIVPLVPLDESTGTTSMWVGSHRMPAMLRRRAEHLLPYTELGTVLLMDYRLLHAGTENRSSRVRPILYNEYCRPWFRDSRNYFKQEPLRMSRAIYERVPDDLKSLFAHLYPQRSEPASVENGAAR